MPRLLLLLLLAVALTLVERAAGQRLILSYLNSAQLRFDTGQSTPSPIDVRFFYENGPADQPPFRTLRANVTRANSYQLSGSAWQEPVRGGCAFLWQL